MLAHMERSRLVRTTLRTLHLIAFGAFYGGHVFDVDAERLEPALVAVIASGTAFFLFEVWRAPAFLTQIRGLAVYIKIALLVSISWFWEERVAILTVSAAIGAAISHAPSNWRYYDILEGRVIETNSKG